MTFLAVTLSENPLDILSSLSWLEWTALALAGWAWLIVLIQRAQNHRLRVRIGRLEAACREGSIGPVVRERLAVEGHAGVMHDELLKPMAAPADQLIEPLPTTHGFATRRADEPRSARTTYRVIGKSGKTAVVRNATSPAQACVGARDKVGPILRVERLDA